jgi:CTX phage RstB protein
MKATVIGFTHMFGTSKKNGKPYNFAQLSVLQPIVPQATSDFTRNGYGFEIAVLDADEKLGESLAGVKFPAMMDLVVDSVIRQGRLSSVVIAAK